MDVDGDERWWWAKRTSRVERSADCAEMMDASTRSSSRKDGRCVVGLMVDSSIRGLISCWVVVEDSILGG